jgi:TetR/AcrR family transcriptional regulator, regulator of cefoperazone and chloramphenicol sensitivity
LGDRPSRVPLARDRAFSVKSSRIIRPLAVNDRRIREARASETGDELPEEKLKAFLYGYCWMLYHGGEMATDCCRIFAREMVSPSVFLDAMAENYLKPQTLALMDLARDVLGGDAPDELVRDCLASMVGAVTYYAYNWEAFSRVFPDHPGLAASWERLADHTFAFVLGGFREARKAYYKKRRAT